MLKILGSPTLLQSDHENWKSTRKNWNFFCFRTERLKNCRLLVLWCCNIVSLALSCVRVTFVIGTLCDGRMLFLFFGEGLLNIYTCLSVPCLCS